MTALIRVSLDVHRLRDGRHRQLFDVKTGHAQLLKWIVMHPTSLITFEATGAYRRQLERALGAKAMPFVKVNPRQAHRFAQVSGKLAKTDRVDCEMLAKTGAALPLTPKPLNAESLYDLRELLSARRALIKDRTAAKDRKAAVSNAIVKQQLEKRTRHIEKDTSKIDATMLGLTRQDPLMSEQLDILSSIPGIGIITTRMILVDLPEMGTLNNKQVARVRTH